MSTPSIAQLQYNSNSNTLQVRLGTIIHNFAGMFHTLVANGYFKAGPFQLQDPDLNRVHAIVNEIDSWRMFYHFEHDEDPPAVMDRLQKVRESIVQKMQGVWATPSAERLVQDIRDELSNFDSQVRNLGQLPNNHHHYLFPAFVHLLVDMRLRLWTLVAYLNQKVGGAIQPKHLLPEIVKAVENANLP